METMLCTLATILLGYCFSTLLLDFWRSCSFAQRADDKHCAQFETAAASELSVGWDERLVRLRAEGCPIVRLEYPTDPFLARMVEPCFVNRCADCGQEFGTGWPRLYQCPSCSAAWWLRFSEGSAAREKEFQKLIEGLDCEEAG